MNHRFESVSPVAQSGFTIGNFCQNIIRQIEWILPYQA